MKAQPDSGFVLETTSNRLKHFCLWHGIRPEMAPSSEALACWLDCWALTVSLS